MERSCIWNFEMKEPKRKLPKSWEEFCEMFPIEPREFFINDFSKVSDRTEVGDYRLKDEDKNMLPDRSTAEAILSLCQLIQLRNAFNSDWVPDWEDGFQEKYVINFNQNEIQDELHGYTCEILYFKSEELLGEFVRCFRPLIEKLKPLYGIKEGGE